MSFPLDALSRSDRFEGPHGPDSRWAVYNPYSPMAKTQTPSQLHLLSFYEGCGFSDRNTGMRGRWLDFQMSLLPVFLFDPKRKLPTISGPGNNAVRFHGRVVVLSHGPLLSLPSFLSQSNKLICYLSLWKAKFLNNRRRIYYMLPFKIEFWYRPHMCVCMCLEVREQLE